METKRSSLLQNIKWLNGILDGSDLHEIEALAAKGIKIVKAERGFFICDFIVHNGVSDEKGNWHIGAMTTLIDVVSSFATSSVNSSYSRMASVDFCISYYSTAKVQTCTNNLHSREKGMEMKNSSLQQNINGLLDGSDLHEIEALAAKGIKIVKAERGFFICDFIIHNGVSDENGNWHIGAMTTLIDIVSSFATCSVNSSNSRMVSVDFCISYYSTAKVQDEVELEANVVGKEGRLTSVIVQVRKKGSAELIALGKQWMTPARSNANHQTSKL